MKSQTLKRAGFLVMMMAASATMLSAQISVGSQAPEINARQWLNTSGVTLADNDGKYTMVEFWATWCGPCITAIPHLVDLYNDYGDQINFISLSDESMEGAGIRDFANQYGMIYPIGTGSTSISDFQVYGIPQAFIVDPDGVVVWEGHPMGGLDAAIAEAAAGTLRVVTPDTLISQDLRPGRATQGTISSASQQFRGALVESYTFSGNAGESVVITLTSDAFDTVLTLFRGNEQVAFNDDYDYESSNGKNLPNEYDSAISYALPQSGTYQVVVSSYEGTNTGSFSLTYEKLR